MSQQELITADTIGQPFRELAADGYSLGGFVWRHALADPDRPLVIINPATSVRCRFYSRFADYLYAHGFDVLTYDYRGIGESRPLQLRGFGASWSDWGALDFEAMLARARRDFAGQPVDVVGHSFGGCALALAASAPQVRRVVTVGAQFAYWRDYAAGQRLQLLCKWHLVMPLLTRWCGYFPGKRLGWMEDTPAGVVQDWTTRTGRYEERPSGRRLGVLPAAGVTAQILAISLSDDPFGTVAAVERLLGYFGRSQRLHLRISPGQIGEREVGHFAFFHSRFEGKLWPIALGWLRDGVVADEVPGVRASSPAMPAPTGAPHNL